MLEYLSSTVFCGRLTPLQPDYSLARSDIPQRQASSIETQLASALFALSVDEAARGVQFLVQCLVFGRRYPRRLRGEGSGRFSGVTVQAQSKWLGGTAATCTKERKSHRYPALPEAHQNEPIAVETMGLYGGSTGVILREIDRSLVEATATGSIKTWIQLFSDAMPDYHSGLEC